MSGGSIMFWMDDCEFVFFEVFVGWVIEFMVLGFGLIVFVLRLEKFLVGWWDSCN